MKYRAIAVGLLKDGHPVQCFSASGAEIKNWAEAVANKELVAVEIYAIREELILTIQPPPPLKPEPADEPERTGA